jgi:hypothetical protein
MKTCQQMRLASTITNVQLEAVLAQKWLRKLQNTVPDVSLLRNHVLYMDIGN